MFVFKSKKRRMIEEFDKTLETLRGMIREDYNTIAEMSDEIVLLKNEIERLKAEKCTCKSKLKKK